MTKFKTIYGDHYKAVSQSGDELRYEREIKYNEDGSSELVICGETDIQEEIQSHADSVDLNIILARYAMGDETVLERVKGFYADVSGMKMNLAEMLNMNERGKKLFDQLPAEIKQIFDNDYVKFLGRPDLLEKMMQEPEEKTIDPVSEEPVDE